ncbi:MAG TPA: pectinesterase family protein, partial [Terracidiphilus sp.]|nr:pectinesterase family protein [Terracidiphilus sp.]
MKLHRSNLRILFAVLIIALALRSAAHAQDNMRGAPYNGYTGVPFNTTSHSFDYLVDSSLAQDDPANKKFKTLQAAYAAAPAGTPEKPTVIGIKPDVYFLRGTDTTESMNITKNYITLLGLTDDRRKVVLADNRGNKEGASNNGFILIVNATGFTMMNLTVVNYCNMDYEYPGDPSKNLKMRSPVITQAVALQADGDKHVYSHVAFLSRLDTLFIRTTRSYFTNVYVEGTDDFIGGGNVGVWENSEVYFPTGRGVMSASGITFIHTVFKASRGLEFYKGFRNPVALIDCVLPVNTPESKVAWVVWKAPEHQNFYSLTYKTKDARGNPAVILDSVLGPPAFTLSRELSAEEAKAFNPWNLLRAAPNGTVDDWDPANVRAKYEGAGSEVFRMALTASPAAGESVQSAASRTGALAVSAGPFANTEPAGNASIRTGSAGATIRAAVLPQRAANTTITWSASSPLISLSSATGSSVGVSGHNSTNHAEYADVTAKSANGFYVTSHIYVEPAYIDPPTFLRKPVLETPVNNTISVIYALKLDRRDDQSIISWYLCDDAACSTRREVAVSRGNQPLRQFTVTPGAVGKHVEAVIQPKHNISDPGPETTVISARPIAAADIKSTTINPNFRNFVATANSNYVNGMWTVLGDWTSSTGENLVNGYGIRIASQGAALLYQQDDPAADMQVKIVMTPEKTAGQGFGIAGSPSDEAGDKNQKADIYIKYDPRTRNGYSLRFWRTTQSAEKCMFQLYQIVNGIGHPIDSQQQLTGVFKPNTTIFLWITGSTFIVKGSNSVDAESLSLKSTIVPNSYGGAGISWSGSVPFGNSNVISQFEISYP